MGVGACGEVGEAEGGGGRRSGVAGVLEAVVHGSRVASGAAHPSGGEHRGEDVCEGRRDALHEAEGCEEERGEVLQLDVRADLHALRT
jgi:hypothetical protein